MSQVTALVLGAINAGEPRNRINAELAKLKAAVAKAAKVGDPKVAMKGWNALKPVARDLVSKAEAAAGAANWAEGQLALAASTRAAIDAPSPRQDRGPRSPGCSQGSNPTSPASRPPRRRLAAVRPRAACRSCIARDRLSAASRKPTATLRAPPSSSLLRRGAHCRHPRQPETLQDHKLAAWPAGSTLEEIDAAVGTFAASLARLQTDAAALKVRLESLKQVDELRKRVELLKPRTDKAAESGVPAFIDKEQKKVVARLAAVTAALDAEDLKKAEVAYSSLGAALDNVETYNKIWARFKQDLAAAKNGEIKTALALKLEPAALAATRTKAIHKGEADLLALAGSGYVKKATAGIAGWIVGAKAWAGAKEASDNMRSDKPTAAGMEKLAKEPGGGPVLTPSSPTCRRHPAEVLTSDPGRYGIKVKQYDHRNERAAAGAQGGQPKTPTRR